MPRKAQHSKRPHDLTTLPKYSIAVASEISGVSQQQLRRMEDSGLIEPQRTSGNTRRYSDGDLTQIAAVEDLASEGINAAGIRYILALLLEMDRLRSENESLRQQLASLRQDDQL
jgi:MerR family transcriptional regulator, heat shock protein HspR